MLGGMLILAGASLRLISVGALLGIAGAVIGAMFLPRTGPKAYLWKRVQAYLDPESLSLHEGFQSIRALRSIGSGEFLGKGYGLGDQNQLGWLPEKHTDMIFAVLAEETGFLGSVLVVLGFLAFCWTGLWAANRARGDFARLVLGGFVCLICGQAAVNLAVVLKLMPVTGVTLPFFSYGGSSLLGCWLGLGVAVACSQARAQDLSGGRRIS
jgi:cell division protein FtsW (lipid II flippase)